MSNIISVLVTIDQRAFIEEFEKKYPTPPPEPETIPITQTDLLKRVTMVTIDISAQGDRAATNLKIKAFSGDSIRWYEAPLLPSPLYSLIINDIHPISQTSYESQWKNYMVNYGQDTPDYCITKTEQMMRAYYLHGNLEFISHKIDYTEAMVKTDAAQNGTLYYNLDFQLVKLVDGNAKLMAKYIYDPTILVNVNQF